ncbi:DNA polymerase III subunit gamma/tau [bacterium]|nr:DNA polymerase III subunit gamma/tau [bacterium]
MSQALYNKYRPSRFDEVVGQSSSITVLENALSTNRLGHAWLFIGPRGTGKTSTSRILAAATNCPHREGSEPCGTCDLCQGITAGTSLALVEIDAASHRSVEDVRELQEEIQFLPQEGMRRVYVIDEVHMLSTHAYNALLKTLEDPPSHVLFVLATTDPQKIPATIRSRCQVLPFRSLSNEDISELVSRIAKTEGHTVDKGVAQLISHLAEGSARDAIGHLEKLIVYSGDSLTLKKAQNLFGVADILGVISFLEALASGDAKTVLSATDELQSSGLSPFPFLDQSLGVLHRLLLSTIEDAPPQEKGLQSLVPLWDEARVLAFQSAYIDAKRDLRWEKESATLWRLAALTLHHRIHHPKRESPPLSSSITKSSASKGATKSTPPPPKKSAPPVPKKKPRAKEERPPGGDGGKKSSQTPKENQVQVAPPRQKNESGDKEWEQVLENLGTTNPAIWVLLKNRPFLGWKGDVAQVQASKGSLQWRNLSRQGTMKNFLASAKETLGRAIKLELLEKPSNNGIKEKMAQHGPTGMWMEEPS